MKALRTKEEAFHDMRRRRKSLESKAEATQKKLSKMGIDNKNIRQQTDALMALREHIHGLDAEIENEEASLGDWKRVKAREWMGVLLGGLLECSEKGTVVARFGRAIIGHVSTEKTQPGFPRALYTGHSRVGPLVGEAERELNRISFASEVGDKVQQSHNEDPFNGIPGRPPSYSSPLVQPIVTPTPHPYAPFSLPNLSPNPFEPDEFGEYSPHPQPQTYTPGSQTYLSSPDQLSPTSPASTSSGLSPSPQGGSRFTPGHQRLLSQSSFSSGSGSVPSYTPLTFPSPLLPHIPHLQLTTPGS